MHFLIIPVVLALALYFLPTMIGLRKRNAGAIFALNLLLGWTLIGWIVALVWALTVEDAPNAIVVQPLNPQALSAWTCSICHVPINRNDTFCHGCGNRIAWRN
jgi:hypothetical protein